MKKETLKWKGLQCIFIQGRNFQMERFAVHINSGTSPAPAFPSMQVKQKDLTLSHRKHEASERPRVMDILFLPIPDNSMSKQTTIETLIKIKNMMYHI